MHAALRRPVGTLTACSDDSGRPPPRRERRARHEEDRRAPVPRADGGCCAARAPSPVSACSGALGTGAVAAGRSTWSAVDPRTEIPLHAGTVAVGADGE
ncbi:hypothetical protein, partial [Brachybacterium paraconglomeratum]|uniref:hypothetical protein n=1 Tax=Brachybacterium paraconglomeratum TaxID=173362 RepID=UPI00026C71C6